MKTEINEFQQCITCGKKFDILDLRYECDCKSLLSIERKEKPYSKDDLKKLDQRLQSRKTIDRSGVWKFREGILNLSENEIITHPEGNTRIYSRKTLSDWAQVSNLYFKHEGENPTGSFKDRGMTVAISHGKRLGKKTVACASTGNTSASLAAYAAQAGMKPIIFIPEGKISKGKLAQAIGYGAICLSIQGDFDLAMKMVKKAAEELDIYLVNSINPFRIEGQKAIIWEILQDLDWKTPDWIVVPGGNLGNTSAFGKALREAYDFGWISKIPRLATIQAQGANPFHLSHQTGFETRFHIKAETLATAIQIGSPVNYPKAVKSIQYCNGTVEQVTEEEIILAKTQIDQSGIGCEPASACSLAGIKKLKSKGVIKEDELIVGILTGNILKDIDAIMDHRDLDKQIFKIEAEISAIEKFI